MYMVKKTVFNTSIQTMPVENTYKIINNIMSSDETLHHIKLMAVHAELKSLTRKIDIMLQKNSAVPMVIPSWTPPPRKRTYRRRRLWQQHYHHHHYHVRPRWW